MLNFTIFTELFAKLGHTALAICDNRLITVDHRILIGCITFLQASTVSSHDVTAIKKAIKYFHLYASGGLLAKKLQFDNFLIVICSIVYTGHYY